MKQKKENSASESREHPTPMRSIRKHEKKLQKIRLAMICILVMVALVGALLLILPLFRVSRIEVEGNSIYSDAEIIAAVGITKGEEILPVFFKGVDPTFYTSCCYVRDVKISYGFTKVKITVVEVEHVMYAEIGDGEWISFDNELRVLDKQSDSSAFSAFLKVKLPKVSSAELNAQIAFENASITYDYIPTLLELLKQEKILENVNYIDYSDKFHLSCVMEERIRLELGDLSEGNLKMKLFYGILTEKREESGCMMIDVSNVQASFFRPIGAEELYK